MKNFVTKIKFLLFFVLFAAVDVENPAPKFFSVKFGTELGGSNGIIANIIRLFIGLIGLISVAYIMYGGYLIATSRGNAETAGAGKKTLTNAIIGLVVVILSYVIVQIVILAAYGQV